MEHLADVLWLAEVSDDSTVAATNICSLLLADLN